VKQNVGHAIGNTRMEAEGFVERNAGKVEKKAGSVEKDVAPSSGVSDNVSGMYNQG
jgi:uncharacterized protein YjbJ (UPF0337 family)